VAIAIPTPAPIFEPASILFIVLSSMTGPRRLAVSPSDSPVIRDVPRVSTSPRANSYAQPISHNVVHAAATVPHPANNAPPKVDEPPNKAAPSNATPPVKTAAVPRATAPDAFRNVRSSHTCCP